MLNYLMQFGQPMIWHHREHVMLDVVIHVPINETADPIHINCATVQAVVDDIISKARVLQNARHDTVPSTVKAGQTNDHKRQN